MIVSCASPGSRSSSATERWQQPLTPWRRAWALLALVFLFVCPLSVWAEGPDYAVPEGLIFPWAYGESHFVTWDFEGHWQSGMATGMAFDVSMPEGTPLFAPANGQARFYPAQDPTLRGLGNYVELELDGGWLLRLAHLRDPLTGSRTVRAGDPLGNSGTSGTDAAHLHLELLVWQGTRWGRPDMALLPRMFGLPLGAFREGVLLKNETPIAQIELAGALSLSQRQVSLGQRLSLSAPLQSTGGSSVAVSSVHVLLRDPLGGLQLAMAQGSWQLVEGEVTEISVTFTPHSPGIWDVLGVTCETPQQAYHLPTTGSVHVAPGPLRLVGIIPPVDGVVGAPLRFEAWFENATDQPFHAEQLFISGEQPTGASWTAMTLAPQSIAPWSVARIELETVRLPEQVGAWHISRAGYLEQARPLYVDAIDQAFSVSGPQLEAEGVTIYPGMGYAIVLARLINVGDRPAVVQRYVLWGRQGGGESYQAASAAGTSLAPGRSALVQFSVAVDSSSPFTLEEIGCWVGDGYRPVSLKRPLPDPAF